MVETITELDLDKTHWQALMNRAYERWNDPLDLGGKSQRDMLNAVSVKERQAVLLGNLNYQVNNGGFSQWADNRYGEFSPDVVSVLGLIADDKDTKPEASVIIKELAKKIETFFGLCDYSQSFDVFIRDGDDDEDECEGARFAESLDSWYYKDVSPLLLPAVEAFLLKDSK